MRLCVIIPYRNRLSHLTEIIPKLSATLDEQGIEFDILVVEQAGDEPFNRAKLFNCGFDYTGGTYDYYCFHDVDLIPVESDYSMITQPTHLSARCEQFSYILPYETIFGGVTMLDTASFKKINGFSNLYKGHGGEDDDLYQRVIHAGLKPMRRNGMYRSLPHTRAWIQSDYSNNLDLLKNVAQGMKVDGLNSLQYKIISDVQLTGFKKLKVQI